MTSRDIERDDEEFYDGACPFCFTVGSYVNVERTHWYRCKTHMVRWSPGWNLYSGWRDEDPAAWEANARELQRYVEVEPAYCRSEGW